MRSPTQVMSHGWLRPDTTVVTWSVGAASAVGVGWTASAPPATRAPTRAIDPRTRSRCTMVTPRLGDLLALLARLRASGQVRASRDLRDVGCGDRRSVPVTTRVSAESHSSERTLEWPRRRTCHTLLGRRAHSTGARRSLGWPRGPGGRIGLSPGCDDGATRRVGPLSVGDVGRPAGDVLGLARTLADVARRRPDESAGLLLLEDVRGPSGRARTREHRREHRRRDLREVEDDGGPELDVRREHPVGPAGVQLVERGLLEGGRGLEAGRTEALARGAQHAGAGVLGTVDAVAEAHEALALVEDALDVGRGIALLLDPVEHVEHARGRTTVERTGHRLDGARERGGDVGTGRGADAGGA